MDSGLRLRGSRQLDERGSKFIHVGTPIFVKGSRRLEDGVVFFRRKLRRYERERNAAIGAQLLDIADVFLRRGEPLVAGVALNHEGLIAAPEAPCDANVAQRTEADRDLRLTGGKRSGRVTPAASRCARKTLDTLSSSVCPESIGCTKMVRDSAVSGPSHERTPAKVRYVNSLRPPGRFLFLSAFLSAAWSSG